MRLQRQNPPSRFRIVGFLVASLLYPAALHGMGDRLKTQQIVYPAGAMDENGGCIIDITKTTLFTPNAKGDGKTDDTAAFIAMMDYLADKAGRTTDWNKKKHPRKTIYLPSGTYLVSDRLVHSGSVKGGFAYLAMVGQDRNNTTIKLKDNSPGYNVGKPKEVLCYMKYWEGYNGGSMWGNSIRNITIDTGSGNPDAIGLSFVSANGGSMDNMTFRSGDGAGFAGLYFPGWSLQGHFTDMTTEGFDRAIRTELVTETNPVLENLTIRKQRLIGLDFSRAAPCVRNLLSENSVEAVKVDGDGAQCVLIDSELRGGDAKNPAIRILDSSKQQLFVRNVKVAGYGMSIQKDGAAAIAEGNVKEWVSGQVFRKSEATPAKSLNLPIEDFPMISREPDPAKWASPNDFPGADDAAKVQAALNSGKPAIYLPRYYFIPQNKTLTIPATVKHIDFMHQDSWVWGGMKITEASKVPLYMENSDRKTGITVVAKRELVARNCSMQFTTTVTYPLTIHFANIAVLVNSHRDEFCPPNVTIYGRSINEESWSHTNFVVNGGTMWVMGFKTEADGTAFHAKKGGFLEVLGGYFNFAGQQKKQNPDVINEDSNVSYIGTNFMGRTHLEGIHEIRGGKVEKFVNKDFPKRHTGFNGNYFVPLYVGYDAAAVTRKIAAMK
ncbi:MAG: hypothetical protein H8M99_04205 [Gloeobacteraceae cyanobacterium ES-bin-144]|nr:hypothetical protein [Verrucomicrobiales bacterium]